MEITNKNKEEIEKGYEKEEIDKIYCEDRMSIYSQLWLCPTCKRIRQERIKTSIQWCEDEIEFLERLDKHLIDEYPRSYASWIYNRLQQLQTHLIWLKEQEISK